ncbi:MAG TPA: hypothetical protein VGK99_17345 [Acidobacteriota bacterium]
MRQGVPAQACSSPFDRSVLRFIAAFILTSAISMALGQKREDLEKYELYHRALRQEMVKEVESPEFLSFHKRPQAARADFLSKLKKGEVVIDRVDAKKRPHGDLDDALIHHWRGTILIPGAKLSDIASFAQNYNEHSKYFKDDVVQSKLLSRNGNFFRVFYKLRRTKVITVYYNTEYDGIYYPLSPLREWSENRATKIAELEDVDKPSEREKPRGKDHGFLWKFDSFWKFEQVDGGVIIECTSLSMSRDIPLGLGLIIGRFVDGIPRESLERTLRTFMLARR